MYSEKFMREALRLSKQSAEKGEIPVGAVIVKDGGIIAGAYNLCETGGNALYHAECSAIASACEKLGTWRLTGCDMYVTMEPCPMCAGAIVNSRISNVYFGCANPSTGFAGSRFDLFSMTGVYNPVCSGGYLESECRSVLKDFFTELRRNKVSTEEKNVILSMIAAVGRNGEIGADNKLLWHISADLKFFKGTTMGKAVIMGRKTFESLPKALPGRKNIVLTKDPDYQAAGAVVVHSPGEALGEINTDEAFIIGGASVYEIFLSEADRLYITEVDFASQDADAFFPDFNKDDYASEILGGGTENGLDFRHILYTRRK